MEENKKIVTFRTIQRDDLWRPSHISAEHLRSVRQFAVSLLHDLQPGRAPLDVRYAAAERRDRRCHPKFATDSRPAEFIPMESVEWASGGGGGKEAKQSTIRSIS